MLLQGLRWFVRWCTGLWHWLRRWIQPRPRSSWSSPRTGGPTRRPHAPPKPRWVRDEIVRLKALMPHAGCRTIMHTFNRRFAVRRQMTVGKTYVADTIRRQQHTILYLASDRAMLRQTLPSSAIDRLCRGRRGRGTAWVVTLVSGRARTVVRTIQARIVQGRATMEDPMTQPLLFVGIDVSKAQLDAAQRPAGRFTVTNTEAGITQLLTRLAAEPPTLIVLETTGGVELPLTGALAAAALPVVVVNPRQIRDFAKATGQLAKTDALDAKVLANFADVVRPTPRPLPNAQTQELAALVTRRRVCKKSKRHWRPRPSPRSSAWPWCSVMRDGVISGGEMGSFLDLAQNGVLSSRPWRGNYGWTIRERSIMSRRGAMPSSRSSSMTPTAIAFSPSSGRKSSNSSGVVMPTA